MQYSLKFLAAAILLSGLLTACFAKPDLTIKPTGGINPGRKPSPSDPDHPKTTVGDPSLRPPILLAQLKDDKGEEMTVARGGKNYGVYSRLPDDDPRSVVFRQIYSANREYRLLVELIQVARRFHSSSGNVPAGLDPENWRRSLDDPLYLAIEGDLSDNAWVGLVLRTEQGDEDHLLTQYVGGATSLEKMSEPIFVDLLFHETGHILFHWAGAPWLVGPWTILCGRTGSLELISSVARMRGGPLHDIQLTTFDSYAMDEGLAETWPVLASLNKPVGVVDQWKLDPKKALSAVSRHTTRPTREDMIRWNRLIFEPPIPTPEHEATIGFDSSLLLYRNSMPIDNHRLRPCRAQMATEGVMASLFLRLAANQDLQEAPIPADLLAKVVPTDITPADWLAGLGPEGRGMLRLVLVILSMDGVNPNLVMLDAGFYELMKTWLKVFPSDTAIVVRTIVSTTMGVTVSLELASKIRRFLAANEIGSPSSKKPNQAFVLMDELLAKADEIKDADLLFAACGPSLWVRIEGKKLCNEYGRCLPFEVDLNAAEEMDFRMFTGITAARAKKLIEIRDKKGWFASVEEFFTIANINAKARASIRVLPTGN